MKKRSAQLVEKAYHELQAKAKAESQVVKQIYQQVTPTFAADDDSIWAEVDLLEGDPARVQRHARVRAPKHHTTHTSGDASVSACICAFIEMARVQRDGQRHACKQATWHTCLALKSLETRIAWQHTSLPWPEAIN